LWGGYLIEGFVGGDSLGMIMCVHLFPLTLSLYSQMGKFKFPLLTPYSYNTWHQNAWNALMQQGYTPYVEQKVTKPIDAKEKVLWMIE
jgi:hypothetical protein